MKIKKVKNQPKQITKYPEIDPKEQDAVESVNEIFKTPLTGAYNWDYIVVDDRIKKLYELGKKLDENQTKLIQKLAARLAHQLETQGDQREITASRAIDMLQVVVKHNPNFTIKDTINFLSVIEGRPIDETAKRALIEKELLDEEGVMTKKARGFQSDLDLDQGIFKRISISKEEAQTNLDNMLSELEDI